MRRVLSSLAFAILLAAPIAALAHPPAIVNEAGERAIGEEIAAFRKALAEAIKAKDVAKLREMYAVTFTHTHTSGKTDNRDARIVSLLAGDPVIETAEVHDLVVRAPNDWVAVVTATSPITSMADGKTYAVKWLQVYTRREKSWVLVASQATRAGEWKP
jgi:hypothetical protein